MTRKAPVAADPTAIDITEVMERIPHRYPMLLVDRCEEYKQNESIVGIKCVSVNEPFFQGHFPDYPVMPGVLSDNGIGPDADAVGQFRAFRHQSRGVDFDGQRLRSPRPWRRIRIPPRPCRRPWPGRRT